MIVNADAAQTTVVLTSNHATYIITWRDVLSMIDISAKLARSQRGGYRSTNEAR